MARRPYSPLKLGTLLGEIPALCLWGQGMKILRHYVGLPTFLLGLAEGGLFLFGLWALGFIGKCDSCYFDDVVKGPMRARVQAGYYRCGSRW